MRVLFSPVGSADPLSKLGDGPMLHLVRQFRPDKVIMYLSSDMAKNENEDHRYSRALNLLAGLLSSQEEIYNLKIESIHSKIKEIYHYDSCVDELERVLKNVSDDNPDAEIIVNTSSGTPAMGNALVALGVFGNVRMCFYQVLTPAKDSNRPGDREDPKGKYDFDKLWENFKVLLEEKKLDENRCIPVESAHLNDLLLRDNIHAFIDSYDYVGASKLAAQCGALDPVAQELISGCVVRMNLDEEAANFFSSLEDTKLAYNPNEKLREYLYVLEVYLAREQWADYVRAITPALTETFHSILKEKLPDDEWLKPDGCTIDKKRIRENKYFVEVLGSKRLEDSGAPQAQNGDFIKLLKDKYPGKDSRLKKCIKLKCFENAARHKLAHAICRVEKSALEEAGRMGLEESLDVLFELDHVEFGLYKRINDKIIELLYQ